MNESLSKFSGHTKSPWGFREHSPKCVIVGGEFRQYANGEAQSQIALATGINHDEGPAQQAANAELLVIAPTAPHECESSCPGEINRRKIEAIDRILVLSDRLRSMAHHRNISPEIADFPLAVGEVLRSLQDVPRLKS